MFSIKILKSDEFDKLPYKRAKTELGVADPASGKAFVRASGVKEWDMKTLEHELNHLTNNISKKEIDNIQYKGDEPQYTPPPAPVYPTAEEIFAQAVPFGKENYPLAYGARESGLADLAKGGAYYEGFQDPQIAALLKQIGIGGQGAADYYQGFQPTSIEQALSNQYFQNVMPDIERSIKQNLSLSGMAYSPILAKQIAEQRGKVGVDIGQYLANLGQTRATTGINTLGNLFNTAENRGINSLNARLGIDPYSTFSPYAEADISQQNAQAEANYAAALEKAQADYKNAMSKYQSGGAKTAGIGSLIGMGLGAIAAPFTGGLSMLPALVGMGGALGGTAGSLFGGGASPISFGDALSIAQAYPGTSKTGKVQNVIQGGKGGQLFNTSQFGQTWSPYLS